MTPDAPGLPPAEEPRGLVPDAGGVPPGPWAGDGPDSPAGGSLDRPPGPGSDRPPGSEIDRPPPLSLARRIVLLPPVRIPIALAFVVLPQVALALLVRATPHQESLGVALASALLAHLSYLAYVRWVERRPETELALRAAPGGLALGISLGAGFITAVVGILWALGCFQVVGSNPASIMVPVLALSIQSGYFEEVVVRGIVFRIAEEGLGTWLSIALSALVFGFLHAGNPNATLVSCVSIAVSAGVLLAAVYVATRRLWPAIGLHFAWNFFEGGVFGIPISGYAAPGWLRTRTQGPEVLTGGAFGIEASVLVPILGLALGAAFLARAARAGRIVPPFWRRRALTP